MNTKRDTSYNSMIGYKMLPYNIIAYLMENNENIWKLLKYNGNDALDKPNLTLEEKSALIYNGEIDGDGYRVFMNEFIDDAFVDMISMIRIFPVATFPDSRVVAIQDMVCQIVVHNKIDMLNSYCTRLDSIIEEFISTLNGADIGGLGVLFMDSDRRRSNGVMRGFSNNRNFYGAKINMSCNFVGREV